jgi:hypothetical protein
MTHERTLNRLMAHLRFEATELRRVASVVSRRPRLVSAPLRARP